MAIDFKLPELGENISSGDVVSILVNEGDVVKANQGIMEVETGKAVVEVPVSQAGRITKIHVAKGQSVAVGAVLVTLEAEAGAAEAKPSTEKKAAAEKPAKQPAEEKAAASKPVAAAKAAPAPVAKAAEPARPSSDGSAKQQPVVDDEPAGVAAPAGPATRRLARELGVELSQVSGTGSGGRITREDVVSAVRNSNASGGRTAQKSRKPVEGEGVAAQDKWGPIRRQPMSRIRKAIAENMGRSTVIPHVTNFDDADITDLEGIRKGSMANTVGSEVKLTMTAFVLKAVAQSLKLHPLINASLDLDGEQVVYKDYVNLGVAVDSERGLIVPVMRDVDQLSIPLVAEALNDLANRVRSSKFTLEDTQGATFTVSNLGAIGGTYSTPIINAPEVAILLLGRSRQLPIWQEDKFVPRLMMPLSLSYDHRLVDGANAARFLNEIKSFLQNPGRLLLAS